MNFIEDDRSSSKVGEGRFGVVPEAPNPRELAIEVLCIWQTPAEDGLADPSDAGEPDD
jgi:hypothetical protein